MPVSDCLLIALALAVSGVEMLFSTTIGDLASAELGWTLLSEPFMSFPMVDRKDFLIWEPFPLVVRDSIGVTSLCNAI